MDSLPSVHQGGRNVLPCVYNRFMIKTAPQMLSNTYWVSCPALGEDEVCNSMEQANDLCFALHDDANGAYAFVEDYLGHTVMEYGTPDELVA